MRRLTLSLFSLLLVLGLPVVHAAEPPPDDPIRAGYERLFQGDTDGAYEHFQALLEPEPNNLAAAYGALWAFYERGLTEESPQKEFERRAKELIQKAGARYKRNKHDTEALFYLAQAYMLRGIYKLERDKGVWGAARDAAKSKKYIEQYLKVDPERADAYRVLGLYNYYVDIAPTFVKFLRIFLFLPGGNRSQGLQQLERAAREGELWAPQAQMELVQIYAWLEGRVEEGLRLARELQRRYPENSFLRLRLANLYASPMLEEYEQAAEQYATIIQRAKQRHPHYKERDRYNALLGVARARRQQWRLGKAVAALTPAIDAGVDKPEWVMPRFLLRRGGYRALLNDPQAAEDARRVVAEKKWKRWQKEAKQQLKWLAEYKKSGGATLYAELIPGNRLVAEHRWEEAAQFYERMRERHPNDWQLRYRVAYLEFARGDMDRAAESFGRIVNSNPARMPDWLKAYSMLYLARLYDLRGQRQQAVKLYQRIADKYENEWAAGAARLGLLTPYRRRQAQLAAQPPKD